jgi:hypothetical protein
MSIPIGAVGNTNAVGFDPSKMVSRIASKMMSDLDPNNMGNVTKDQFISALTDKGVSRVAATKMYDAVDTKNTGSIGKSDLETAIKNGTLKPPAGGPPGGPHGSRGHGDVNGKPGGGKNTSTDYSAADTNQDGVVSVEEAAIYEIKHPSTSTIDKNKTDQSKLGKNVDKLV